MVSGANPEGEELAGAPLPGTFQFYHYAKAFPSGHPEEVCPFHRRGKWRFVSQCHGTLDVNSKHTIKGLSGHFEIPSS